MAFDPSKYEEYLKQLQTNPEPDPTISSIDPAKYPEYLDMLKGTPTPAPAPQAAASTPDRSPASVPIVAEEDPIWHPPMAPIPEPTMQAAPAAEAMAPPGPKGVDFGEQADNGPKMFDALAAQNNMNLIAGLGKSADQIAQSIAGTKHEENPVYSDIQKQAAAVPGQYKALKEDDKHDPNSQISQGFRDYVVNQLNIPIKGNPSADDLSTIAPYLFKNYEARLAEQGKLEAKKLEVGAKKEQFGEKLEENKRWHDMMDQYHQDALANSKTAKEAQDENKTNGDFMKMAEKLSAAKASSRSALGKAALNKAAAERIETLVAGRNLNDLDTREIQEVARSLDSLLAQGQPTISGSHDLVPKTFRSRAGGVAEYILNVRQGAGAESFLQQMIKTVKREKELANKQKNEYINQLVPGFSHLEKKDPERFNTLLNGMLNSPSAESAAVAPAAAGQEVLVRRKSDGKTVKLSADKAAEYLQNPDFEEAK